MVLQGAPQNFLEIRIADLSKSVAIFNRFGLRMLRGAESTKIILSLVYYIFQWLNTTGLGNAKFYLLLVALFISLIIRF